MLLVELRENTLATQRAVTIKKLAKQRDCYPHDIPSSAMDEIDWTSVQAKDVLSAVQQVCHIELLHRQPAYCVLIGCQHSHTQLPRRIHRLIIIVRQLEELVPNLMRMCCPVSQLTSRQVEGWFDFIVVAQRYILV